MASCPETLCTPGPASFLLWPLPRGSPPLWPGIGILHGMAQLDPNFSLTELQDVVQTGPKPQVLFFCLCCSLYLNACPIPPFPLPPETPSPIKSFLVRLFLHVTSTLPRIRPFSPAAVAPGPAAPQMCTCLPMTISIANMYYVPAVTHDTGTMIIPSAGGEAEAQFLVGADLSFTS